MKYNYPLRIRLLFGVIVTCALVLVLRLYMVQIVSGADLRERADRQYVRPGTSLFNRGSIYFTNKDGSLASAATQQSGFTIAINPTLLKNPQTVYEQISKIVPLNSTTFFAKVSKKNDPYEEILKGVDTDTGEKIKSLNIPGVILVLEKWRVYPGNNTASHALGLVGYKGNELAGRYGLERYYEDTLSRSKDSVYVNFFAEIFSSLKQTVSEPLKTEGDVVTSIEPVTENFLEKEIKQVQDKWQSNLTGGIIINPQNGEIYAMAVTPDYNPNTPQDEKNSLIFSNPLVERVYEMGSIIKPITMATGIDTGVLSATTTYMDTGSATLNGKTFSNYDKRARGLTTMQEVLNQSLNIGAAAAEKRIGNKTFAEYLLNFSIGEKSGIDLPNEATGIVDNLKSTRDIEYATASFGQGIAMTPLATVRALSVLANGGVLITPHVATQINFKDGLSKTLEYPEGKRVIKKSTADEITRMLVEVVDTSLEQGKAKNSQYSVAAKTGTAQIAKPGGGGYYDDRLLHSFFGYFPAYNPKFLVFLYTYDPKGVKYAVESLTPPFLDLTKFLINYYEVPPDR